MFFPIFFNNFLNCVYINDKVENHEFLTVTISFDHDIVEGDPVPCFMSRFSELIEKGLQFSIIKVGTEGFEPPICRFLRRYTCYKDLEPDALPRSALI